MKVAFRTSAGSEIGLGHLRRCMTLADVLRQRGADSVFLIDGDPLAARVAEAAGFPAQHVANDGLPADAAIVVVDSYRVGAQHLRELARTGARLVVVDDLADRALDAADVVVNAALGADTLYSSNGHTRYLLGPTYALLRSEFASEPPQTISRRIGRVLITAGGSDPRGLTPRLAHWAGEVLSGACLEIVLGPFSDVSLDQDLPRDRVVLHRDPSSMRELMVEADVALCAGGQTLYEVAACATPAIAIQVAENQARNIGGLEAEGTLLAAGRADEPDLERRVKEALIRLDTDPELRARMGSRARRLVDGQGAGRVAQEILA